MSRWTVTVGSLFQVAVLCVGAVEMQAGPAGAATEAPRGVSRVEVVLAHEYKAREAEVREEFVQAGLQNIHFQYAKRGQPPQNIGMGREVPAELAREVIRLATKYNIGVNILLHERLFPPRFVTIASSNYDDTVEYPIDTTGLAKLSNPELSTDAFHEMYRSLTITPTSYGGRNMGPTPEQGAAPKPWRY
ncbi:MAG: hypothetical protein U0172_12020 [Nitrospiraceae bacterium]